MKFTLPILVIGTGRCGTSIVARLLHEECGIDMGEFHNPPTEHNPGGTYEEFYLYQQDANFVKGHHTMPCYLENLTKNFNHRGGQGTPWGYKTPMAGYVLHWILAFMAPHSPYVINVTRTHSLVVASHIKCFGWDEEHTEYEIKRRKQLMNISLKAVDPERLATIRFTKVRRKEGAILAQLEGILDKWGIAWGKEAKDERENNQTSKEISKET